MSSRGYQIKVQHKGLNKHRVISGSNQYVAEQKAKAQSTQWEQMWKKRFIEASKNAAEKEAQAQIEQAGKIWNKKQLAEAMQKIGEEQTKKAQDVLEYIDRTLSHALRKSSKLDWNGMKDNKSLRMAKPRTPKTIPFPREPLESDGEFKPAIGLFEIFSSAAREKSVLEAQERFRLAHDKWKAEVEKVKVDRLDVLEKHKKEVKKWESECRKYRKKQAAQNEAVDKWSQLYGKKEPNAILDYCDMVLINSEYPELFPKECDLDYNSSNSMLIVDYAMPAPSAIPVVKEVKHVKSRGQFAEVTVSKSEANRRYDSLLYMICLRTIYELFQANIASVLDQVVFNGWVQSIDPATGKEVNGCVLSLHADRASFAEIDLAYVDPKACFKALKGVGSSKLHSLTPVAPVIAIDRNDRRFVSSYEVTDQLDEGYNLAAMDWEDFEHLIRELFEQEFTVSGGEVKVTQASRDGGVDAVAFDPDPIRGGKIVIQAKRYTNTVSVAAVRDLYGAVINEGANKGILVTTSDYGSDAYEFTKGKPLTLLNGANLLALLEKHGHQARIDLKEAKLLQANT